MTINIEWQDQHGNWHHYQTKQNQAAREVLSRAAERQIGEEEYEAIKEKALALGLVRKGRGRAGSIALGDGIEGGSRYEAPAAPSGNERGRAKKEATLVI